MHRRAWRRLTPEISSVAFAGTVQGLIHDIPTCAVLVARIVAEAEAIIGRRLAQMMSARVA